MAICLCGSLLAQTKITPTIDDLQALKEPGFMQLSPNGDELVYTVADQLWLVSTRNPNIPKQLVKGSLPCWSPDGKRLAYYSNESGAQQLWVLDIRSNHAEQVSNLKGGIRPDPRTRIGGWIGDPLRYSWSPDGTKLVFASQVESAAAPPAEQSTDAKPGTPLILTGNTPPAWTLSGIFAKAFGPDNPAPLPPVTVSQLFVVDVSRKLSEQLTNDDAVYFNPAWSPDGRTIACASSEGRNPNAGPTNIYAIAPATGKKSPLTTGAGDKRLPRWSADGKWIAYTGGEHFGMQSVFVIPAKGGTPTDVGSKVGRYITQFEWLADSKSLGLLEWDGVNWPIVRVRVPDGAVKTVTTDAAAMRPYFSVSRTGTLVWA